MRRLIAILLVAAALSPGLFLRSRPVHDRGTLPVAIAPLALPAAGLRSADGLTLTGAWVLDSRSEAFGGYSALLPLPGGELLALSDRGWSLRFYPSRPDHAPAMGAVGDGNDADKRRVDIEGATRDPAGGTIWLSYESTNSVVRYDADLVPAGDIRPPAMRGWPANRGPEAFVRLADGRFVILSEEVWGAEPSRSVGLLFPGDPVAGAEPATFRFVPPTGFRPTDMAQLPDGRVVILLRRLTLGLPPRLSSRLVVADPAEIAPGAAWPWRPLAEIGDPAIAENYEGLAIVPRADGSVRLWLIADDNGAAFQRTLLLALDGRVPRTNKKARRIAARPSAAVR